jgi:hypothetical protein
MQDVSESPGFAFDSPSIAAEPPSLSSIATEPEANVLPAFAVVAVNAEYVPSPAAVATEPTTASESRIFRPRDERRAHVEDRPRVISILILIVLPCW